MKKDQFIEMRGKVIKQKPNTKFDVQLYDNDYVVECTLCGRLWKNKIKIIVGDDVDIEISPYDLTKGRITYRN